MPDLDGFSFLAQIESTAETALSPIIVMSADVFDSTRQQVIAAGARAFIQKPLNLDELLELLQIHLGVEWQYVSNALEADIEDSPQPLPEPAELFEKLSEAQQAKLQAMYIASQRGDIGSIQEHINHLNTVIYLRSLLKQAQLYLDDFELIKLRNLLKNYVQLTS